MFFFCVTNRNCANENRQDSFKAATMLGRPKDDFNVWVMGEVQVNNLGEVVQEEARKYVYVQELTAIKHLLEEQDRKVFRKLSDIDRHSLRGLLPKNKHQPTI